MNAKNTLPKAKSKPSFVIVKVHQKIQDELDETKEELLIKNEMNVAKVSSVINRACGKTTKLIRVKTETRNHILAAQKARCQNWLADD